MEANEGQGNPANAQFLIDQIKEAQTKLNAGKFAELPQEVQNGVSKDMTKYDEDMALALQYMEI